MLKIYFALSNFELTSKDKPKAKSNGRTCKKKGYYYNQWRQRWCFSNNGCRKIHQANHHPSNKRNYKTLQEDPTLQHSNLVNNTISRLLKKPYFLKNWLNDRNPSIKTPQTFTFHPRYIKKTTQEDQRETRLTAIPARSHVLSTIICNL